MLLAFDEHVWRPVDGAASRVASVDRVRLLLDAGAHLNQTSEIVSQVVRSGSLDILKVENVWGGAVLGKVLWFR